MDPKELDVDEPFEITTVERAALARLAQVKEWDVFVDVMSRFLLSQAWGLAGRAPVDTQNVDLVRIQGGVDAFRKMVQYVRTSEPAPGPKRKP